MSCLKLRILSWTITPAYDLDRGAHGQAASGILAMSGIYNPAYFEHAYLAQGMGAELVEGVDLLWVMTTVYTCAQWTVQLESM